VTAVVFIVVHVLAGVGDSRDLRCDVIDGDGVPQWQVAGRVEAVSVTGRRRRGRVEATDRLAVGHGEDENHEDERGRSGDEHRFTDLQPPPPLKPTH